MWSDRPAAVVIGTHAVVNAAVCLRTGPEILEWEVRISGDAEASAAVGMDCEQ